MTGRQRWGIFWAMDRPPYRKLTEADVERVRRWRDDLRPYSWIAEQLAERGIVVSVVYLRSVATMRRRVRTLAGAS